ncbi:DNA binding protein [Aureococcus anophagefferens]|nr:DNA binding protein [Aureococcus anophagefferens]
MAAAVMRLVAGAALAHAALEAGTWTNTNALGSSECYAPTEEGGWGYCGAPTCRHQYTTCPAEGGGPPTVDGVSGSFRSDVGDESNCISFLDMSDTEDVSDWGFRGACTSDCTQRTDGVCDGAFLEQVIKGPSIKYAFCNDKWLVLLSSGEGGVFEPHLNNYPLDVVDLPEGSWTNNVDLFDGTAGNAAVEYAYSDGTGVGAYGLPDGAGVGITVNGMQNWVTQNNRGVWNQPTCEASPCNGHVGQGAGQPHIHGDLFSDTHQCLYGTSNYTSTASHPPIVGFGADGHLIYGRYLGDDAPGFASPLLDDCGGHMHDDSTIDEYGIDLGSTYHYHTQIFDYTCGTAGSKDRCDDGDEVIISTTGPLFCFRADLSQQEGSSALLSFTSSDEYLSGNDMNHACCGMTDYYVVTGNIFNNLFDNMDTFFHESSTCTVDAHPDNGAYASSYCAPGHTLYSGNGCHVTCDSGYEASGITRCVKGAFVEYATCVASGGGGAAPGPTPEPTEGAAPGPTPEPTEGAAPGPTPEPTEGAFACDCDSTAAVCVDDGCYAPERGQDCDDGTPPQRDLCADCSPCGTAAADPEPTPRPTDPAPTPRPTDPAPTPRPTVVAKRRQLLKQNAQREVSLSSMPVTESSML